MEIIDDVEDAMKGLDFDNVTALLNKTLVAEYIFGNFTVAMEGIKNLTSLFGDAFEMGGILDSFDEIEIGFNISGMIEPMIDMIDDMGSQILSSVNITEMKELVDKNINGMKEGFNISGFTEIVEKIDNITQQMDDFIFDLVDVSSNYYQNLTELLNYVDENSGKCNSGTLQTDIEALQNAIKTDGVIAALTTFKNNNYVCSSSDCSKIYDAINVDFNSLDNCHNYYTHIDVISTAFNEATKNPIAPYVTYRTTSKLIAESFTESDLIGSLISFFY